MGRSCSRRASAFIQRTSLAAYAAALTRSGAVINPYGISILGERDLRPFWRVLPASDILVGKGYAVLRSRA